MTPAENGSFHHNKYHEITPENCSSANMEPTKNTISSIGGLRRSGLGPAAGSHSGWDLLRKHSQHRKPGKKMRILFSLPQVVNLYVNFTSSASFLGGLL